MAKRPKEKIMNPIDQLLDFVMCVFVFCTILWLASLTHTGLNWFERKMKKVVDKIFNR